MLHIMYRWNALLLYYDNCIKTYQYAVGILYEDAIIIICMYINVCISLYFIYYWNIQDPVTKQSSRCIT